MGKKRQSNVPYAIRLRERKAREIGDHREDAARTAMYIALVKLNDMFGLGWERLAKFSRELTDAIVEFYKDPEVEWAHVLRRLEQIGFEIENGMPVITLDTEGKPVKKQKGDIVVAGEKSIGGGAR